MLRRSRCVLIFLKTSVNREKMYLVFLFMSAACVLCVFSSHSFWTSNSLDVPAGVTQEEGHTGFLIHLLSAVRALTFLARRNQLDSFPSSTVKSWHTIFKIVC